MGFFLYYYLSFFFSFFFRLFKILKEWSENELKIFMKDIDISRMIKKYCKPVGNGKIQYKSSLG